METLDDLKTRLEGKDSIETLNGITTYLIEKAQSGYTAQQLSIHTRKDIKKKFGFNNKDITDILDSVDNILRLMDSDNEDTERDKLQNPYLPDGHVVPDSFFVGDVTGYYKKQGSELIPVTMCAGAMTVVKTGDNMDDGHHWLTLRCESTGARRVVERHIAYREAMSRNGIMAITDDGITLTDTDAGHMSKYIARYLDANRPMIDELAMANTCGWKANGFVCGNRLLNNGTVTEIQLTKDEVIKHMQKVGDRDTWFKGIEPMMRFDVPRFKLYAGMSAPILKRFNLMSAIVHTYGDSSIGKSASDCMVSSGYGKPGNDGLQQRADGTAYSFELKAVASDGCILVLDETSGANADIIKKAIYNLSNGGSRGKGSINHTLQEEATWSIVVLTTGETPILEGTEYTGQGVRVISINGCIDEKVDWVPEVEKCVSENYGFLIEDIITIIQSDTGHINRRYEEIYAEYSSGEQIHNRRARTFAAFAVMGEIVDELFLEYYTFDKSAVELVKEMMDRTSDRATHEAYYIRALDVLMQWVAVNRDYITDVEPDKNAMYSATKQHKGYKDDTYLYITSQVMRAALKESGMDFKSAKDEWVRKGIAATTADGEDENGNPKKRFGKKIPHQNAWAGALDRRKIAEVLKLEYDEVIKEDDDDDIIDNTPLKIGASKSQRELRKKIRDEVKGYYEQNVAQPISEKDLCILAWKKHGIDESECKDTIQILKKQGELMEPTIKHYKTV